MRNIVVAALVGMGLCLGSIAVRAEDSAGTPVQGAAQPPAQSPAQNPAPKQNADDGGWVQGDQKRFDQGLAAYDAGRFEEAFKIFSELADNEDLAAMRNVAFMERKGLGTKRDPEAALNLYEYVARAGLPTAQFDYAEMLIDGEAGEPDPAHGIPWLVLAAQASHPRAQYRLGQLYEAGTVIPKDLFKAQLLYAAAAAHGEKRALDRLSAMFGWPMPGNGTGTGAGPAQPPNPEGSPATASPAKEPPPASQAPNNP